MSFNPKRFDQFRIENIRDLKYLELIDSQLATFGLEYDSPDKDQKWSFETSSSPAGYIITSVKSRLTAPVYLNYTAGQTDLGCTTIETSATIWTVLSDSSDEFVIYSASDYLSAKDFGNGVELVSQASSTALPPKMKWKIDLFSTALVDGSQVTIQSVGSSSIQTPTQYQYQKLKWTVNQQQNGMSTILLENGLYLARKQDPVTGEWSVTAQATPEDWNFRGTNTYTIGFLYDHPVTGMRLEYVLGVDKNDDPELEFLAPGTQPSQTCQWTVTILSVPPGPNPPGPLPDPDPPGPDPNYTDYGSTNYESGNYGNFWKEVNEVASEIQDDGMIKFYYTGNKITVPEDRAIGQSGFRSDSLGYEGEPITYEVNNGDATMTEYELYAVHAAELAS